LPLYFIALIAPDEINRQVLEWKRLMLKRFNCKVALRAPAHITVIPPFHMPETLERALIDMLDAFGSQQRTIQVHLQNFAAFAPRVIYVQVQPDQALQQVKENAAAWLLQAGRFPIRKDERPFQPHITIASRDLRKGDFATAWSYFQDRLYQASFEAGAISLLRHNAGSWGIVADSPFK